MYTVKPLKGTRDIRVIKNALSQIRKIKFSSTSARPLEANAIVFFCTLYNVTTCQITQFKDLSQVTFNTHIALQMFESFHSTLFQIKMLASVCIQLPKSFFRSSCSP
ncbi:unnamed protein product [Rotaria magnacalcarata]